ncbi:polymerase/histidinol phosphatase-like protein [Aspergillus heterothallicus]
MKLLSLLTLVASATACADHVQRFCTDRRERDTFTGRIFPSEVSEYKYIPFEVSPGVTSISITYDYTNRTSSSVYAGVFDERGHAIEDGKNRTAGFRGWSFALLTNWTFTPAETTPMYVGGPVAPGTWSIVLVNSNIAGEYVDYNISITYGYEPVSGGRQRFSLQPAPADLGLDARRRARMDNATDGEVWLRGDFHVHTTYSDGTWTPQEQVANAQSVGLDFWISTEHNSVSGNNVMGAFAPADMLVGRGMEVTTRFGHWQAVGLETSQTPEWRYGPGSAEFADAVAQVRRGGGFVSVNHPYMPCKECIWNLDEDLGDADAVEIWNYGITEEVNQLAIDLWQRLLVQGRRITGIGGSDTHNPPSMIGWPTTKVKARSLSTAAVVEGVKRRRVYIAERPEMEVDFTVRGEGIHAQIGDVVELNGAAVTARLVTQGYDGQTACFVTENGYLRNETIQDQQEITLEIEEGTKFLRVELRNSTGSFTGLTNPIYLE